MWWRRVQRSPSTVLRLQARLPPGVFGPQDDLRRRHDDVRVQRHAVYPVHDEKLREVRMVARRLAAEADFASARLCAVDCLRNQVPDGRIALVELVGDDFRIAIDTSVSCVRSFDPMENPSKYEALWFSSSTTRDASSSVRQKGTMIVDD